MQEKTEIKQVVDEIKASVEESVGDSIESVLTDMVEGTVRDAIFECMSEFEFVLKDGTIVRPCRRMKLLSPDKKHLCVCYGGLKVWKNKLSVQVSSSCWDTIATYPDTESAIAALNAVKDAMESGTSIYEL